MSIDWKLLFHQLFALEIKKEFVLRAPEGEREAIYSRLLNAFVHYSPEAFGAVIERTSKAESAEEAHRIRESFYKHPVGRALIHELDLERCVGAKERENTSVREFLAVIHEHRGRAISDSENFLASPEGENAARAFGRAASGREQKVALVMVPGYAAHTIAHAIFEEIVGDANAHWGRPRKRPLLSADGIDLEFESATDFYERGAETIGPFDILHPAGIELGNTIGLNAETTDRIAIWIRELPKKYAEHKFVFLGYSKGAPIVLDLERRHPELASRILGYVTHAGVMQGAHVARAILEQADSVLRDVPLSDFVDTLRNGEPGELGAALSPLFAQLDMRWLSAPRVRELLESLDVDVSRFERQSERILGGRELRELLDGGRDLAPLARTRWNLLHLNNKSFRRPTYLFNLSAVADVRDFVRPVLPEKGGAIGPSLIAPRFTVDGQIDWETFSIDAMVLYFTSYAGFKNSPGGLYDAQVDLAGSKTMHLDSRPLSESLTSEELDTLWEDEEVRAAMRESEVPSREAFASTPRSQLVASDARDNLDAIDLGEFRGHHWSLFVQALRPPEDVTSKHASWPFPRKAYMRALLQLLALRNLVDVGEQGV